MCGGVGGKGVLGGVYGIIVSGWGGVPGDHEPIYQGFVVRGEIIIECSKVVLPLWFRSRAGNRSRNDPVIKHPGEGKLARSNSARACMFSQLSGDLQALPAPLGFHDSFILTACSGILGRRGILRIVAGYNSASDP